MIALLAVLVASAGAADADRGPASAGHRIEPLGQGTGLGVAEEVVVGPDGGTQAFTVSARVRVAEVQLGASVPFTSFRVPGGRDNSLGNARLWAAMQLPWGNLRHWAGIAAHFDLGGPAYTWVNAAPELWPGAGIEAFWEARLGEAPVTWMLRGSLGVHGAVEAPPFPDRYVRFQVAGGVDATLVWRFGIVGETAVQYWDTSPWEISGLLRLDPMKGLRLRAGVVMPVGVWAGWTPAEQTAGVREATLKAEVVLAP